MSRVIDEPTILIIVGITGDLAGRKLLPALNQIYKAGVLPDSFKLIGISRRDVPVSETIKDNESSFLRDNLTMIKMDLTSADDYTGLKKTLDSLDETTGTTHQRLLYLSVPPDAAGAVIEHLGVSGLNQNLKLLLEKPFGDDVASSIKMAEQVNKHFSEKSVYRIDHFMAKEMSQNIIVFRARNALFRRTWNRDCIDSIVITAEETLSIEGRSTFYEQTGALKDVLQSHLMQLAALTLMELPGRDDWDDIPLLRQKALEALQPPTKIVRAQYKDYRQEVDNEASMTETFVSLTMQSSDPNWLGVPITLTTGKSLSQKATEIVIHYKKVGDSDSSDKLTLQISPVEGAELCLLAETPGFDNRLEHVPLRFRYTDHFKDLPEAYERVFVDAMRSEHTLFTTSEEVIASWKVLQPVLDKWAQTTDDLLSYNAGDTTASIVDR